MFFRIATEPGGFHRLTPGAGASFRCVAASPGLLKGWTLGYLMRGRGRNILLCFVATSVLLVMFPQIDLAISGIFAASGFSFAGTAWQRFVRGMTTAFLCVSIVGIVLLYLTNRALERSVLSFDGKRLAYVLIVLVVGAGLIVNLALKDNFGRARPRDVVEFGGGKIFTAAFAISTECRKNCSFSSGEAAAGFFSIALVYALGRRRRMALVAAISFGAIISMARIASGAHFLSDTIVSFFIMWFVADGLHYYMRLDPADEEARLKSPGRRLHLVPARAAASAVSSQET
jgi:lipid A 4'-phosphatase